MKKDPKELKRLRRALDCAVNAAQSVGRLLRKNLHATKKINSEELHDIKLELDVLSQELIQRKLQAQYPNIPILGEEGVVGDTEAAERWVVDPIDGTVNFAYGIPHACVSIALQTRIPAPPRNDRAKTKTFADHYHSTVGVVYDPFVDELWTAIRSEPARLNNRPIRVSQVQRLNQAVISIGFAKGSRTLQQMLPTLTHILPRARKIRIMGAAALSMVYVATGRFDAYVETGIRLWDIAAGGLILECAGGEFWHRRLSPDHRYALIASNGCLRRRLPQTEF